MQKIVLILHLTYILISVSNRIKQHIWCTVHLEYDHPIILFLGIKIQSYWVPSSSNKTLQSSQMLNSVSIYLHECRAAVLYTGRTDWKPFLYFWLQRNSSLHSAQNFLPQPEHEISGRICSGESVDLLLYFREQDGSKCTILQLRLIIL